MPMEATEGAVWTGRKAREGAAGIAGREDTREGA